MFHNVGLALSVLVIVTVAFLVFGAWGLYRVLRHCDDASKLRRVAFRFHSRRTSVELLVVHTDDAEQDASPGVLESEIGDGSRT
ncbi:hypothetical protein GCM10011581_45940 [Saccharopolyspora subtropica]|uniref:Uncharacterized protein n=1 Tax=Saccharopolyspora thermophila TaxID=89367 RepID=A0A917NIH4_9PSEU|nr:hypothetical protein GCM10011581_45940 [Saccharopolyspora subtropica]